MGLRFKIMPSSIDETITIMNLEGMNTGSSGFTAAQAAAELAARKVKKVIELLEKQNPPWIAGADTLISLDGEIFGKPKDREDAWRMLSLFRGRSHEVSTGMALYNSRKNELDCRSITSIVCFSQLRDSEIEWYLDTGEWQGVAGAYKIQGLAACFIPEIKGSYSSIVGLPLHEFYAMLKDNGYQYGDTV